MSFCTQCGARLDTDARFCAACGAPAQEAVPVEQAVASVAAGAVASPTGSPLLPPPPQLPYQTTVLPGGAPAGEQPGARQPLRVGQLSAAQTSAAVRNALVAVAVTVAVFLVFAAVLAAVFAPSGHRGSPVDWFRSGVAMLAIAVHGAVKLTVSGQFSSNSGDNPVSGHFTVGATWTPLVLTFLVAFAGYRLARRAERAAPSEGPKAMLAASALTGATFAVAAAVLAAISSGGIGYGVGQAFSDSNVTQRVGADPWLLLPGAFVIVTLACIAGRASAAARLDGLSTREWAGRAVGSWRSDARHARSLFLGAFVVTIVSAVVAGAYVGIHAALTAHGGSGGGSGPGPSGKEIAALVVMALLAVPNLVAAGVGAALGGTLGSSTSASAASMFGDSGFLSGHLNYGVGLLTGGVAAEFYLVVLPMLAMALLVGARVTYQRNPSDARGAHVWRTAVLFAAAWLGIALLIRISASVSGSADVISDVGHGSGSAAVGLGLPSLLGAAFVWAIISSVGGSIVARFVAAASPSLATRIGGARMDFEWALLVADSALVHGSKVPSGVVDAADALRNGLRPETPPLTIRPVRDKLILAGVGFGVAAFIAGIVIVKLVGDTTFGPSHVVTNYLAKVQAKNVNGALALVSKDSLKGLDRELMTASAVTGDVADVHVKDVREHGKTAEVTVAETVGGSPVTATYTLSRDGHTDLLFPRWKLIDPFSDLSVSVNGSSPSNATITVNGVSLASTDGDIPVLPGSYSVNLDATEPFQPANTRVYATGDGSVDASLSPSVDPAVQTAAESAVRSFLDQCAQSSDVAPSGCPFSYWDDTLTNVSWSITNYPTLDVQVADDGTITVTSSDDGVAHLAAVSPDYGFGSSPVSDDESFSVDGTVTWGGGDPSSATFSSNS